MKIFALFGHDNNCHVLPQVSSLIRCEYCGNPLNKWSLDLTNVLISTTMDVSYTIDGYFIVSNRFKSICEANNFVGAKFMPVRNNLYILLPEHSLIFDSEKRRTSFEVPCAHCNKFKNVIGATPVFLKPNDHISPLSFYRTDLEFGSGDCKHPLILCGENVVRVLKPLRIKKLDIIGTEISK